MKKPVVAAVGGPAVGIGTHACCCIATWCTRRRTRASSCRSCRSASCPEFGSTFLLPLIAGYQRAAELLLLGQPFTAQKAHEAGIVTESFLRKICLRTARKGALALAALPPESIRLTKRLMKARHAQTLAATIEEETRIFTERLTSPEAKEAMSAFLEKRKPDFSRF